MLPFDLRRATVFVKNGMAGPHRIGRMRPGVPDRAWQHAEGVEQIRASV